MPRTPTMFTVILMACLFYAQNAAAQAPPRDPVTFNFDGGMLFQSSADLKDTEGDFSVNRWFLGLGVTYAWDRRNSIGLSVGGGAASYDFDDLTVIGDGAPWEDIEDTRISLVGRFGFGEKGSIIIVPSARYNGEDDSKTSDGRTWGVFAAAAWRLNEDLTIGPGIGVFSRLENGTRVFPILVIDWNISERWKLSTGRGLGASQGPGLNLSYKVSEAWSLGVAARYENVEFRLVERGTTEGGVGRDRSLPLLATAKWAPNKVIGLSVFAGIELGGELRVKNALDEVVGKSDYDPAAIFGATFELRF